MGGEAGHEFDSERIPSLAAIWVYREAGLGLVQFLLVQRSAANLEPDYPGLWGIITEHGNSTGGDKLEPISATAIRGIASEISADGEVDVATVKPLTGEIIYGDGAGSLRVQMFLARAPEIKLNPQELQNFRWGTLDEIKQFYRLESDLFIPNFTFAIRMLEESLSGMVL